MRRNGKMEAKCCCFFFLKKIFGVIGDLLFMTFSGFIRNSTKMYEFVDKYLDKALTKKEM
jgi:hypothetical protein